MNQKEIECVRAILVILSQSDVISEECGFYPDGNEGPDDMCLYNRKAVRRGPVFTIDMDVFEVIKTHLPQELLEVAERFCG